MIQRFDADTQWQELSDRVPYGHRIEARRSRYGDDFSRIIVGMTPFHEAVEERPDLLIQASQFEEQIYRGHEEKTFPVYHQYRTWAPEGEFHSNQNGLGYCWAWSGTAALMDCMAVEDKEFETLAPVSMGYLVNWANRGNYLESFIKGAREDGICPGEFNSLDRSSRTWDAKSAERKKYRLDRVWDTDVRQGDDYTIQQAVSILRYGVPIYIAYNWWGHALELVAVRWDTSQLHNIVWVIRNSHNEDDVIELTGSRGVPDEMYGFVSSKQYVP